MVAYTLASECFNTGTSLYFPATFFTMKWLNAGKHNHTHVNFFSKTLQFCVEKKEKAGESDINREDYFVNGPQSRLLWHVTEPSCIFNWVCLFFALF